jgi:hypothetical protein
MKHIQIDLEDREYKALLKVKGDKTWKELLMSITEENK